MNESIALPEPSPQRSAARRATTRRRERTKSGAADRPRHATPISVVLAEDRPVARKLIVEALESEGEFEVVATVRDGQGAVDAVRDHAPDVVVLDVVMPGLNGLQATREIRRFSDVPTVIFTGARLGTDELRLAAKRAGADALVLKPADSVGVELLESLAPLRDQLKRLCAARRDRQRTA